MTFSLIAFWMKNFTHHCCHKESQGKVDILAEDNDEHSSGTKSKAGLGNTS